MAINRIPKNINENYLSTIEPQNLVKQFVSEYHFRKWLSLGTEKDLQCCLLAFEKEEMYEYCAIIKNEMDKMKNLEFTN